MANMKKGAPYFSSSVPQYDMGPRLGKVSGTKLRESADIFSVENYKRKRPDVAVANPPKVYPDRSSKKVSSRREEGDRPQIGGTEGVNWPVANPPKVYPDRSSKKAEPSKKNKTIKKSVSAKKKKNTTTYISKSTGARVTGNWTSKGSGERIRRPNLLDYIRGRV